MEEANDYEKTSLKQKFWGKKNAANKAAAKARDEKQQEWYKRMEEDGGNYIFKLSSDRDRDSEYTTRTSAMKRSDGILVTGVKQVLGVWEEYFKKLLNLEGECEIEMMRELEVRTITEEEVEKTVKKIKTGKAVDELSVEMVKANELMGIKWLNRLFMHATQQERYQQSGEEE